jgi:hypothetical protein
VSRVFSATSNVAVFISECRRQTREVLRRARISRLRRNHRGRKEPSPEDRASAWRLRQSHLFMVFVLILLVLVGSVLGFLINMFHVD